MTPPPPARSPDPPPAPGRVALLGLRASGKTTVGRALALRLGWPFLDLDEELARLAAEEHPARGVVPAGDLLATLGEAPFRELERRALERVAVRPAPLVLATGGGVVETPAARDTLARGFRCVWLRVPIGVLLERLAADPTPRPPLVPGGRDVELATLAARRDRLYRSVAEFEWIAGAPTVEEEARRLAARLAAPPPA